MPKISISTRTSLSSLVINYPGVSNECLVGEEKFIALLACVVTAFMKVGI